MQNHTLAHAYQVDSFLAVILAVIDPFDRQRSRNALITSGNETPWSRQLAAALVHRPFSAAQPSRWEGLFLPLTRHSLGAFQLGSNYRSLTKAHVSS
jgi:hypothetical protein